MKPNDTVTHVALPDRVLTVEQTMADRVWAYDGTLSITDTADNFRPYPPRKSTAELKRLVDDAIGHLQCIGGAHMAQRLAEAATLYAERLQEEQ